jgi:hypothetical protein
VEVAVVCAITQLQEQLAVQEAVVHLLLVLVVLQHQGKVMLAVQVLMTQLETKAVLVVVVRVRLAQIVLELLPLVEWGHLPQFQVEQQLALGNW